MKDDTRPFPIQGEPLQRKPEPYRPKPSLIPWWLAEFAYKNYNYDQSLEQIKQRGGFGRKELITLFCKSYSEGVVFGKDDTRLFPIENCSIPWWLAEVAFINYNKWPGCTLESVAKRGGWTRSELVNLLRGVV